MAMLLSVVKVTFVGLLFLLFITFFGYPSLKRYLEGGVLLKVSTTSNPSGGVLLPAITLCPFTPNGPYECGWKNNTGVYTNVLRAECDKLDDNNDILDCVNNKTYTLEETVKNAIHSYVDPKSLMNKTYWSTYLSVTAYGKCHVLKYEQPFSADFETDSLTLFLNPELSYRIYIHDPKYFFTTHNMLTIPQASTRKHYDSKKFKGLDYFPLVITERNNINRQEQPCEEDVDYDFTDCVIENIAAKVGCRYPWDKRPHSRIPICNDLSKIEEQETIFHRLSVSERKVLVNKSGCFPPCRYREYKIWKDCCQDTELDSCSYQQTLP